MRIARPTLLLTRPEAQSQRFAAQCRGVVDADYDLLISPILKIETVAAPDLADFSGVIFTSENAVNAVVANARPIPAYCVGPRTAMAAARAGFVARSADGHAESLRKLITQARPKGALLHLRGEHQTGDLANALRSAGLNARSEIVYRQHALALSPDARHLLDGENPVILPLFSRRSARLVLEQVRDARAPLRFAALSPAIASELAGISRAEYVICDHPDADHMARAVAGLMAGGSELEGRGRAG